MAKFLRMISNLNPFFDADTGAGAGGAGAGAESGGEGGEAGGEANPNTPKALTEAEVQAKIDSAVKTRLEREKKKNEKVIADLQKQLLGDGGTGTGGTDGNNDNNDTAAANETLNQAKTLMAQANQRVLEATATTEAVKLGIDPKYVGDAVKLADLSKGMGEDGAIDPKVVSAALSAVLERVPAFKLAGSEDNQGGFKVGGDGKGNAGGSTWGGKAQTQTKTEGKRWNRWN